MLLLLYSWCCLKNKHISLWRFFFCCTSNGATISSSKAYFYALQTVVFFNMYGFHCCCCCCVLTTKNVTLCTHMYMCVSSGEWRNNLLNKIIKLLFNKNRNSQTNRKNKQKRLPELNYMRYELVQCASNGINTFQKC